MTSRFSGKLTPEAVLEYWNSKSELPKARMTHKRRSALMTRLKEHPDADTWFDGIDRIAQSVFCTGENSRGWKATFDFIALRRDKIVEAVEGKYDTHFSQSELEAAIQHRFHVGMGRCYHDPECQTREDCVEKVALQLRKRR
jgi:hypothetical protein